ncbi:flavin containing monooxygenase FMO-1 [Gracilaria domingensis]|nr:flavin containing monooxygenase FMO-1 [Gracilaria domingensis]
MATLCAELQVSSICVIGAGAAGLAAVRAFRDAGFRVQAFEATSDVGGTWAYSPLSSESSAVYKSLRCNIPSSIMCYTNEPFPKGVSSFPQHTQVLQYLKDFARKYDLYRSISFNTRVTSVMKHGKWWKIQCEPANTLYADAVIVCNGHYRVPNVWSAPGLTDYIQGGGNISHSKVYKEPQSLKDKRVLVIGSGPSGLDIGLEISRYASHVYLSHRQPQQVFKFDVGTSLSEVTEVKEFIGGRDIELRDGKVLRNIDHILCCTGYNYSFPFLHPGVAGVSVSDNGHCVRGLIKHLIAEEDLTISFPGLPWSVIPFPLFEDQIAFLVALYSRKVSISKLQEIHEEDRPPDVEDRYFHKFGLKQWEYRRQLASLAGREPVGCSPVELNHDAATARKSNFSTFRNREYVLLGPGPGEWRVFVNGEDVSGRENYEAPGEDQGSSRNSNTLKSSSTLLSKQ